MNPNSTAFSPVDLDQLGSLESRMARGIPESIAHWDRACESLCAWEKVHLCAESTDEELTTHDRWLCDLVRWGRLILNVLRQPGADKAVCDSVEERVGHLEDKYAVWHAGMTSENEARVIDAAYD